MPMSQNGMFKVNPNNKELFVRGTLSSKWLNYVRKDGEFNVYIPAHPLCPNDCLKFAESLVSDVPCYDKQRCVLKEESTNLLFGHTYVQNMRIAKMAVKDEDANPNVGEAYAIVRMKHKNNTAPYHIATVIAKDGNTNITMEADAGADLTYPIFDMYDVHGKNPSFHMKFNAFFSPASTIVLTKR